MFTSSRPLYAQRERRKTYSVLWRTPLKTAKEFCLFTTMHGFNHIAWPRRHLFERFLWAFVTAAAIWGAVGISLGQLQRYNENPTVVTLEKDFRAWKFSLPGFTACDENRVKSSKLPEVIQQLWNVTPGHEKYEYYSRFVHVAANSDLLELSKFVEFKDDDSLQVDLFKLVVEVVRDPQVKTTWSVDGAESDWTLVMTEAGACYTTNSLAIADVAVTPVSSNETKMYPITCKYAEMSCFVILEVSSNCSFYMHSPYDIMDITIPASRIILTQNRLTALSVMETRCGKGVQVFSTNSCRMTCRSKLALKLCGCKPFYYFYEEGDTCSTAGMACLASFAHLLSNNGGDKCACAQQCVDAIFKEISTDDQFWAKGPFVHRGSARFTVQAPRTRYTREIVFYFQDLVVSFGGAAGLFLGASFISFVEIFYFIIVRVLRLCVQEPALTHDKLPVKQPTLPFETRRLAELTSILERQRNYEHGRPMKMYY